MALLIFAAMIGVFLTLSWPLMERLNRDYGRSTDAVQARIRGSAPTFAANGMFVLIATATSVGAVRPWKPLTWRTRPARIGPLAVAFLGCVFAMPVLAAAVTTYIPQMMDGPPVAVSGDTYTLLFRRIPMLSLAGMLVIVVWLPFSKDARAFWAIKRQCKEMGLDESDICENCGYILTAATCSECGHVNRHFRPKENESGKARSR